MTTDINLVTCALCPDWVGRYPGPVDMAHAQDVLVSHHVAEHGRPAGGHWPVYDNSAAHAETARRFTALRLESVEHDYTFGQVSLWARFKAWRNRPRCTCPRTSGVLPPLHGGYRPHPQPPRPICLVHPPPPRPHPPIPPSGTGGGYSPRRKGTW